jgi:hypothetical protein
MEGTFKDNTLLISSSSNGKTWNPCISCNQTTSVAPAMAVFQEQLWVAFRSNDSTNYLLIASSKDSTTWPTSCVNVSKTSAVRMSIASIGAELYIAFQGQGQSLQTQFSSDGHNWNSSSTSTKNWTQLGPCIIDASVLGLRTSIPPPESGDAMLHIYNLMLGNPTVFTAMFDLTSPLTSGSLAVLALESVYILWQQGLLWSVLKLALPSMGWYALGWLVQTLITWICAPEVAVAATLTTVIVWEAQMVNALNSYSNSCPAA